MKLTNKMGMLALASVLLVGCGSDTSADGKQSETSSDVYFWTVEGVDMYIDADEASTVDKISEEAAYFESTNCAFEGLGKIYTYNDYVVTFFEDGDESGLCTIQLKSDLVETNEGITIGSTLEEVKEVYGEPTTSTNALLEYEKNGTYLRVILSSEVVVSIEIAKVF